MFLCLFIKNKVSAQERERENGHFNYDEIKNFSYLNNVGNFYDNSKKNKSNSNSRFKRSKFSFFKKLRANIKKVLNFIKRKFKRQPEKRQFEKQVKREPRRNLKLSIFNAGRAFIDTNKDITNPKMEKFFKRAIQSYVVKEDNPRFNQDIDYVYNKLVEIWNLNKDENGNPDFNKLKAYMDNL